MKKGFKFRYVVSGIFPDGRKYHYHSMSLEKARQAYFYLKYSSDAVCGYLFDGKFSIYCF